MGHKIKRVAGNSGPDLHYENRVMHKERECSQQTSHEVGKSGSIRSRSRSHVSSQVHSRAAAPTSPKSSSKSHGRTASKSGGGGGGVKRHHSTSHSGSQKRRTSGSTCGGKGGGGDKCGGAATSSHKGGGSQCGKRSTNMTITGRERCYDQPRRRRPEPCRRPPNWQNGKYVRDECGSGFVPKRLDFKPSRKLWCKTPLTMYQATIGELGRKLLCRETVIPRDVRPEPPCNIAEYIQPPCRGYYRKHDCLRPCEEEYVSYKQGKKVYRDRVERYWEPCMSKGQKHHLDLNSYANHNVALGLKVRRHNDETPCW